MSHSHMSQISPVFYYVYNTEQMYVLLTVKYFCERFLRLSLQALSTWIIHTHTQQTTYPEIYEIYALAFYVCLDLLLTNNIGISNAFSPAYWLYQSVTYM